MGRQVRVDEEELAALREVADLIPPTTNAELKAAIKRLEFARDPFKKHRDALIELIQDGLDEHSYGRCEDAHIIAIVDDIFDGSDWVNEVALSVYEEVLDTIEAPFLGLVTKTNLRDQLAQRLGLEMFEGRWATADQVRKRMEEQDMTVSDVIGDEAE
jgi:hypothetical protein